MRPRLGDAVCWVSVKMGTHAEYEFGSNSPQPSEQAVTCAGTPTPMVIGQGPFPSVSSAAISSAIGKSFGLTAPSKRAAKGLPIFV